MKTPVLIDQHRLLATTAARLLADRQSLYPGLVEKGTMTNDEAAAGIRIMAAISAQWTNWIERSVYVCQHDSYWATNGREGARADEMRSTLASAAEGAVARWRKNEVDQAALERACAVEALAWWQQPWNGGVLPRIGMHHRLNRHLCRPHAERKAA